MLKKRRRKRKRETKTKTKTQNYKENIDTKLITNTKKHKLKIQSRVWNFRYTMLYKRRRERKRERKKVTKTIKRNIYRYKIDLKKYQKAKIKNLEQSLEFQKYNVKEKKKKKKGQKIIKYIYMKFAEEEKNRVFFFCKVIVGCKIKTKAIIEDLKFFKKIKKKEERMIVKIVKIYLGLSLVLL